MAMASIAFCMFTRPGTTGSRASGCNSYRVAMNFWRDRIWIPQKSTWKSLKNCLAIDTCSIILVSADVFFGLYTTSIPLAILIVLGQIPLFSYTYFIPIRKISGQPERCPPRRLSTTVKNSPEVMRQINFVSGSSRCPRFSSHFLLKLWEFDRLKKWVKCCCTWRKIIIQLPSPKKHRPWKSRALKRNIVWSFWSTLFARVHVILGQFSKMTRCSLVKCSRSGCAWIDPMHIFETAVPANIMNFCVNWKISFWFLWIPISVGFRMSCRDFSGFPPSRG